MREGLRALLERTDDIVVTGEADDGDAGVRAVTETRPDVVLMDIRMPGTDGIAATRRIVDDPALSQVHVVVLTTFDTDDNVLDAGRARATPGNSTDSRNGEREILAKRATRDRANLVAIAFRSGLVGPEAGNAHSDGTGPYSQR